MPRLPRVTSGDVLKALHRDGWHTVRQSGSHIVLKHPTKPGRVVVARHAGVTIKPKTLATILEQAGLTADDLKELL